MNIYSVDYWIPFPSSEYGGLVIMAARTVEDIRNLAWDYTSSYDQEHAYAFDKTNLRLTYKVIGTGDYKSPCIIVDFTT